MIHKEISDSWINMSEGQFSVHSVTISNIDLSKYEFIQILWSANIQYPYPSPSLLERTSSTFFPIMINRYKGSFRYVTPIDNRDLTKNINIHVTFTNNNIDISIYKEFQEAFRPVSGFTYGFVLGGIFKK